MELMERGGGDHLSNSSFDPHSSQDSPNYYSSQPHAQSLCYATPPVTPGTVVGVQTPATRTPEHSMYDGYEADDQSALTVTPKDRDRTISRNHRQPEASSWEMKGGMVTRSNGNTIAHPTSPLHVSAHAAPVDAQAKITSNMQTVASEKTKRVEQPAVADDKDMNKQMQQLETSLHAVTFKNDVDSSGTGEDHHRRGGKEKKKSLENNASEKK